MRKCGANVHSRSGYYTRPGADFTLSGPVGSLHDAFRYCAVSRMHLRVPECISLIADLCYENSLRMPSSHCKPEVLDDVDKCVTFLKDMEIRWSGAKRSRVIIEQLLQHQRSKLAVERDASQR